MIDIILARDPHDPWIGRHIPVDFKGTHDLSATPLFLPEYIELIGHIVDSQGDRQFEVVDERVDFHKSAPNLAVVWQAVRVAIFPERLVRNALKMYKWRLDLSGTWVCYEHIVFWNSPLMSGKYRSMPVGDTAYQNSKVA